MYPLLSITLVALPHCRHGHHHCHPLLHPHQLCSQNTIVPVAVALAVPTLFTAALISRALSLIFVALRCAHVHRPHLPLPLQVYYCLFTPLAVEGVWGHHLPLLFSGLAQLPLVIALKMSHRGCGVVDRTGIPRLWHHARPRP